MGAPHGGRVGGQGCGNVCGESGAGAPARGGWGPTPRGGGRMGILGPCLSPPDKRGRVGLQILENFAAMLGKGA